MTRPAAPALASPELLDALAEAVVVIEAGRVVGLNRAAAELLRVPAERAAGRPAIEVLRHHRLEEVALGGGEAELELGGRLVLARGLPGGLILEDVTESRRREGELREVMAVLSHEFRTPVAAVKGLLEALQYELPDERRARFVEIALGETDRLVRLVEDLTVGFRPTRERRFPVEDALERVLGLVSRELIERDVRVRVAGERALVRADPDKLAQVLINLVENAARHGPNPGLVRVRAELAGPGSVAVRVLDEGAELPDYGSLFDAHRRGPGATGPGTGMGLYIVRSIVEAWGGRVWAHHGPHPDGGLGNEFGFTLPAG